MISFDSNRLPLSTARSNSFLPARSKNAIKSKNSPYTVPAHLLSSVF